MIEAAHRFVLGHAAAALQPLLPHIAAQGTSDLTWQGRKFSGNSMRCRREYLLYHGTLLCDFDLPLITRYLKMPPRQPDYRGGREHEQFVTNLPLEISQVRSAVVRTWRATTPLTTWPRPRTRELVREKYGLDSWNRRIM
jgi:lipoate-protein ligase A